MHFLILILLPGQQYNRVRIFNAWYPTVLQVVPEYDSG